VLSILYNITSCSQHTGHRRIIIIIITIITTITIMVTKPHVWYEKERIAD
jgi:hypothetical protein